MIEKLSASSLLSSKTLPIQDLHLANMRFSQKLLFWFDTSAALVFFYAGLSTSRASYVTTSLEFGELTDYVC